MKRPTFLLRLASLAALLLLMGVASASAASPALLLPPPQVPRGPRIYKLPFPGGTAFPVCQGNNHAGGTHTGLAAYAWDFCMPIGSPVTAARAGTVVAVRQDSNISGWGPAFADAANYVVVDQGDGTSGLYMHLMHDGARVRVGDHVETGQFIGYSGNTGWTSAPHLHFMVMRTDHNDWYSQSLPVLFVDVAADGGLPLEDRTYTSGNASLDPRLFSPNGPPPFVPFWVETFKTSSLWSGVDDKAVSFGPVPPWRFFLVVSPQAGARLKATAAGTGALAYIPASDVGPSGPPSSAGPQQAPPAAPANAAPSTGPQQIVVTAGDTLSSIAQARGVGIEALIAANHLADANHLSVGQVLVLPAASNQAPAHPPAPVGSGQAIVKAGDTLSGIAAANHVTADRLASLNHLADPNALKVGQVLTLT